jgi:hypothetical protein|tara:strand:+ start:149 stop:349 length:201 start_codon:yes stop_codon:yes gene_type:complete
MVPNGKPWPHHQSESTLPGIEKTPSQLDQDFLPKEIKRKAGRNEINPFVQLIYPNMLISSDPMSNA